MSNQEIKKSLEIRFSLFSLTCLMICWLGITFLAFYLGSILGRMEQSQETQQRYLVPERKIANEETNFFSFDKELTKPDNKPVDIASPSKKDTTALEKILQAATTGKTENSSPIVHNETIQKKSVIAVPSPAVTQKKKKSESKVVQIASFRDKERAELLVHKLKKKGYRCFSNQSSTSDVHAPLYQVFVGPFSNSDKAFKIKTKIEEQEGFRNMIVRTGSDKDR